MMTDRELAALEKQTKSYYKSCESDNCLNVRVSPKGKKTFVFIYTPNQGFKKGKLQRLSLGVYTGSGSKKDPDTSLKDANEKAQKLYNKMLNGIDPWTYLEEKRREEEQKKRCSDVWAIYDKEKQKELVTRKKINQMVEKDFLSIFGTREIDSITTKELREMFKKISYDRESPSTTDSLYSKVKKFLNYCVVEDLITSNPINFKSEDVGGDSGEKRDRYLSELELKAFFPWIESSDMPFKVKSILKLLILSGQRVGATLKTEWKHIDYKNLTWFIPKENQKRVGKKGRATCSQTINLTPLMINVFKELEKKKTSDKWVFPALKNPKNLMCQSIINEEFDKALDEEMQKERPNFREPFLIHDLRHTFSSLLNERGFSSIAIEKILSHQLAGEMRTYANNPFTEQKKKVWIAWDNIIQSLLSDEKKVLSLDQKRA